MRTRNAVTVATLVVLFCVILLSTPVTAANKTVGTDDQVHALRFSKTVPNQLNYQGFLVNAADSSAITATLEMTFRLYDSETKGAELWSEIHPAVEVKGGLFQVLLGSLTSFPGGLFGGAPLWLQTEVGTEILSPRKPLVSVAYSQRAEQAYQATSANWATEAQHAIYADTADYTLSTGAWTVDGDNVYRETGRVGIGTTSPLTELDVDGSVNAATYYGDGSHLTNISGTTDNDWTIDGNNVYHELGNVGIGTASPSSKLDVSGTVNTDSLYEIGGTAVLSAAGSQNVFVGPGAGANNTGGWVTFVGANAGFNNQSNDNVFVGRRAGYLNTTGGSNTYLGQAAGNHNTEGSENTFLGSAAGYSNVSGHGNTCLGRHAGYSATGDSNVFIGYKAGFHETGSNNLYIANGPDTSDVLIYGDFSTGNVGIGVTSPTERLEVAGKLNLNSGLPGAGVAMFVNGAEALWYNDFYFSWGYGGSANYFADWVSIGTEIPGAPLTIEAVPGTDILFSSTGNNADIVAPIHLRMGTNNGHPVSLMTNNLYRMTVLGTGQVGIGTTSPVSLLEVENHSDSPDMRLDSAVGGAAYLRFSQDDDQKAFIRTNANGDLQLDTEASGLEAITILNSNANVGIGVTTPARTLHVGDAMRLEPTTAPSSPQKGDMYMDSSTNKLMVYDGTVWQACW